MFKGENLAANVRQSRTYKSSLFFIQRSAFIIQHFPRAFTKGRMGVRLVALRIALVILHGDPARGGAERYTVDLAAALRGRGHDAAVVASGFPPGELPAGAVRLDTGGGTRLGRYLSFLDQLDRHL
ncbi:MAG: glycosyl transferase, group 1, partial [Phycisphaerales bacterium]|nr:glycosyl transferase, group 1 [Phycisphaerales bacterium]